MSNYSIRVTEFFSDLKDKILNPPKIKNKELYALDPICVCATIALIGFKGDGTKLCVKYTNSGPLLHSDSPTLAQSMKRTYNYYIYGGSSREEMITKNLFLLPLQRILTWFSDSRATLSKLVPIFSLVISGMQTLQRTYVDDTDESIHIQKLIIQFKEIIKNGVGSNELSDELDDKLSDDIRKRCIKYWEGENITELNILFNRLIDEFTDSSNQLLEKSPLQSFCQYTQLFIDKSQIKIRELK